MVTVPPMWYAQFARQATRSIALPNSGDSSRWVSDYRFVRTQLTTIRIKRSVPRRRAVSANAARKTDAVDRENRERNRVDRTDHLPWRETVQQWHFPETREAWSSTWPPLAYEAG